MWHSKPLYSIVFKTCRTFSCSNHEKYYLGTHSKIEKNAKKSKRIVTIKRLGSPPDGTEKDVIQKGQRTLKY